MYECGTDAEAFSSNMEFLYGTTDNGIRSRDIDFEISQTDNGLEISGYDPVVKESDSSDDDGDEVMSRVREVAGNYSNANIERFHANFGLGKSSNLDTEALQALSDKLREESQNRSSFTKVEAGPEAPDAEPQKTSKTSTEETEKPKTKKNRRQKFSRNIAIESILGIQRSSTGGTGSSQVSAPLNGAAGNSSSKSMNGSWSSMRPSTTSGLPNGGAGRGRGRGADKSRPNFSMIRPECIHGYDKNRDYDPNDFKGNLPPVKDDFPPL